MFCLKGGFITNQSQLCVEFNRTQVIDDGLRVLHALYLVSWFNFFYIKT